MSEVKRRRRKEEAEVDVYLQNSFSPHPARGRVRGPRESVAPRRSPSDPSSGGTHPGGPCVSARHSSFGNDPALSLPSRERSARPSQSCKVWGPTGAGWARGGASRWPRSGLVCPSNGRSWNWRGRCCLQPGGAEGGRGFGRGCGTSGAHAFSASETSGQPGRSLIECPIEQVSLVESRTASPGLRVAL